MHIILLITIIRWSLRLTRTIETILRQISSHMLLLLGFGVGLEVEVLLVLFEEAVVFFDEEFEGFEF